MDVGQVVAFTNHLIDLLENRWKISKVFGGRCGTELVILRFFNLYLLKV